MTYDFDTLPNRRGTDSAKWSYMEPDVLPLFVADMDFRSPEPVIRALHERVEHGYFGYVAESKELKDIICDRLARLYQWEVKPDHIHFLPGLVSGLNLVGRAIGQPGDGVLVNTPVYHPFLYAIKNQERSADIARLRCLTENGAASYEIDFDAIEAAITPRTRLFMFCNPHNPVGRVYQKPELEQLADAALRHDLIICSDEIHCDILYDGHRHIPIASLAPEIAERTITLMAPSKTFNLPGLGCGYAIASNPDLLNRLKKAGEGIVGHHNPMGFAAAIAAYREGQPWLDALLTYLTANRDYLAAQIAERFPAMRMSRLEGTYLAWLDCRDMDIPGVPCEFFLKEARVGFSDGAMFGHAGEGFVRLCIASPRAMLTDGLDRMQAALERVAQRQDARPK